MNIRVVDSSASGRTSVTRSMTTAQRRVMAMAMLQPVQPIVHDMMNKLRMDTSYSDEAGKEFFSKLSKDANEAAEILVDVVNLLRADSVTTTFYEKPDAT
jgi:hypothetical protein